MEQLNNLLIILRKINK